MSVQQKVHRVDPGRLAFTAWDRDAQSFAGEGDIVDSYSADRIGMGQPIRRPFTWRGGLYVCTALTGPQDQLGADAYQLLDAAAFGGVPVSYAEKTLDAEAARNDPHGFYHGMVAHWRGRNMVLSGPPVRFVAGPDREPSLFAAVVGEKQAER